MSSDVTVASGLAGRYATALFELSDEEKQLDQVASDLNAIKSMLSNSEDLRRFIQSPVVAREDQQKAMQALLQEAGIGQLTRNLIGVVVDNRRLHSLSSIIDGYFSLLAKARGETTAEVISANSLSKAQQDAIMVSLKREMGSKVTLETRVDETLLGGIIVKIGSKMIDTSLKTKLAQLRLAMKGAG
ncbi:MAG: F0F1 ATP synthase subunit delta [Magnetovibrio sp.]|nr:F0F1 ATP synthase subunit delta [Magnetovibrio sp.]